MKFEEMLREKIKKSEPNSVEKNLYRLLLGNVQQVSAKGNFTDEQGMKMIQKEIKANEECLEYLKESDERNIKLRKENEILNALLPSYLTVEEIKEQLNAGDIDLSTAKNAGQAIGMAVKYLKGKGLSIEGGTVKEAVSSLI